MSSTTDGGRVCTECGESAGTQPFCGSCGVNLAGQKRLPTRAEWEARRTNANQPETERAKRQWGAIQSCSVSWIKHNPRLSALAALLLILAIVLPVVLTSGESTSSQLAKAINKSYATHGTTCSHEEGIRYSCEIETQHCRGTLVVVPASDSAHPNSFTIEEARPEELRNAEYCDNPGGE